MQLNKVLGLEHAVAASLSKNGDPIPERSRNENKHPSAFNYYFTYGYGVVVACKAKSWGKVAVLSIVRSSIWRRLKPYKWKNYHKSDFLCFSLTFFQDVKANLTLCRNYNTVMLQEFKGRSILGMSRFSNLVDDIQAKRRSFISKPYPP